MGSSGGHPARRARPQAGESSRARAEQNALETAHAPGCGIWIFCGQCSRCRRLDSGRPSSSSTSRIGRCARWPSLSWALTAYGTGAPAPRGSASSSCCPSRRWTGEQTDDAALDRPYRAAEDIRPDERDLQVVRGRARAVRRRHRRAALVSALVALGIVAGAVLVGLVHRPSGNPGPVAPRSTQTPPSPGTLRQLTNPFAVLRTIDGEAVGIYLPLRVAVAPDGHVYVSDRSQHITELERGQVRSCGDGADQALLDDDAAAAAAAAQRGRYREIHRIQVFTSTGRLIRTVWRLRTRAWKFTWSRPT